MKRLIGYVRVSTDDQAHDAQMNELRAAGCDRIFQEHGSGASRARPVLTRLLRELSAGDVLVVVRLDRVARSVSHLLQVIEDLEERGARLRRGFEAFPPFPAGRDRFSSEVPIRYRLGLVMSFSSARIRWTGIIDRCWAVFRTTSGRLL
ncbi:hypothetical protein ATY77_08410 [Rhizobium sp. R634]|nr:hypothetical protein ATY77_07160 [Rhizobium sp. R634]OWV73237.1 hypothetical protein ATY77_08410 [Rhizobium sp. R634]